MKWPESFPRRKVSIAIGTVVTYATVRFGFDPPQEVVEALNYLMFVAISLILGIAIEDAGTKPALIKAGADLAAAKLQQETDIVRIAADAAVHDARHTQPPIHYPPEDSALDP